MLVQSTYLPADFDPIARQLYSPSIDYLAMDRQPHWRTYDYDHEDRHASSQPIQRDTLRRQKSEAESSSPPKGKRTTVACLNCRNRKTKCSGDPGNGLGCRRCQTHGSGSASCQFARAGCFELPMKSQFEQTPSPLIITTNPTATMPYYATYQNPNAEDGYDMPASLGIFSGEVAAPPPAIVTSSSSHGHVITADTPTSHYFPGSYATSNGYEVPPQPTTYSYLSAPISPLSMTSLHTTLPDADYRRLPMPAPQGAACDRYRPSVSYYASDSRNGSLSSHSSVSPVTSRRQSSMYELAHASSLMQPITRIPGNDTATHVAQGNSVSENMYPTDYHGSVPTPNNDTYVAAASAVLPPLVTSSMNSGGRYEMLPPPSALNIPTTGVYCYGTSSAGPTPDGRYYGWRPINAPGTEHAPVNVDAHSSSDPHTSRYTRQDLTQPQSTRELGSSRQTSRSHRRSSRRSNESGQ